MTLDGGSWRQLDDLGAYRITEIPRRDAAGFGTGAGDEQRADPGRRQRAAALTAAYHGPPGLGPPGQGSPGQGSPGLGAPVPVVFGWIRTAPAGPVHVIAAGNAPLALPGARATELPPGGLSRLLDGIGCWREVAVVSDGLLAGDGHPGPPRGLTFEECLLGSQAGPFGWIVIALPLPEPGLRALATDVARRLHLARSAADRFPERETDAERLAARHAELRRGASAGFWRIRVAAGGPDPATAARVAGLLCAAAELDGLPYALIPGTGEEDGSTELLAALIRPPETEIPGVRLTLRPEFDVTPDAPPGPPEAAAIRLGDILDRNLRPAGPFGVPPRSLNRHVFVCGATGAGKSHTVRTILEGATARGIPWLVVEPAKAEYRLMANRLGPADGGPAGAGPGAEVIRIRPGEADAIAAGLNPLEPAAAGGRVFPLQTHADLVRALFIAAFRSEEPFPQVLSAALTRAYEEAGWDLALGEAWASGGYPTLSDLQRAAESVVSEIGYSQRVTDDVLGFVRVRLASLRAGTTGRFLEGGHPVDFGRLLERNVVLEIEDVGDDRDKAFLMGTVLIRLAEHLRLTRGGSGDLRHLTVIEEAHRLLRRTEPGTEAGAGGHAVEMFAGLLAEIRAYGEGLIVAEQIPARVIPDVVKNTAVKVVHRLPAADDRDSVGATMNLTPAQSRYLVTLPPGQAAVFADGMDHPILIKIFDSTKRDFATAPSTADCASVVEPRSDGCGPGCRARPCTLREMRQAQRLLAGYPWLRLWAELTVAAHLAGWPMPVPVPPVLARLKSALPEGAGERLMRCAVSQAVDAAVAVRRPVIAGIPGAARVPGAVGVPGAAGTAGAIAPGGLAAHA
ncbi:MAG: ATP-binding protein, partial [Nocardiopsaceae bacterium]|nr:ATP-binding protein [Nocardiopsaceae bacterium]